MSNDSNDTLLQSPIFECGPSASGGHAAISECIEKIEENYSSNFLTDGEYEHSNSLVEVVICFYITKLFRKKIGGGQMPREQNTVRLTICYDDIKEALEYIKNKKIEIDEKIKKEIKQMNGETGLRRRVYRHDGTFFEDLL